MAFTDHSMFMVIGHLFPLNNLWSYQVFTKTKIGFLSRNMNAKLGHISCYYRQAPYPYLTVVYSHSRIIIKWSSKMNHEEKVKFHFLEIWRTYIFLTVGLNDRDFIQVVSEQHLWISERSSDSQLAGRIDCLWNNCQFEEFTELLSKKRISLWVVMVRYAVGNHQQNWI